MNRYSEAYRRKVREKAVNICNCIETYLKKKYGNKMRQILLKDGCLQACNIMMYSEPHKKQYWDDVAKYVKQWVNN